MNTHTLKTSVLVLSLIAAACSAQNGAEGPAGLAGAQGTPGTAGPMGPVGQAGMTGAAGEAGASGASAMTELDLPGAGYYPESLTAAKDGSLYVGSIGGDGIMRVAPGAEGATKFVAPNNIKSVAGVMADDADGLLYACEDDLTVMPYQATVRAFDLATGAAKASYPFPTGGFCNDFAFDGSGNLFVTDSFGKIYELAKGASSLSLWSADPLLAPSTAGGFGADGIAFDGTSNLYVNTFSDSRLLRIPVKSDGSAGAVTSITVTPALANPDGMRLIDATDLLMVEGGGNRLTKVTVSDTTGASTALVNRLDTPTSVVVSGGSYWITEGQLPHFLGAVSGPPNLPFLVRRFTVEM
jgi:sugar lactone lactonase YvrE